MTDAQTDDAPRVNAAAMAALEHLHAELLAAYEDPRGYLTKRGREAFFTSASFLRARLDQFTVTDAAPLCPLCAEIERHLDAAQPVVDELFTDAAPRKLPEGWTATNMFAKGSGHCCGQWFGMLGPVDPRGAMVTSGHYQTADASRAALRAFLDALGYHQQEIE